MKIAFLFPGQGSQAVGMGRALAESSAAAAAVWKKADEALGFSLSRLCFEGPADALELTANTQPAVLAASVAAAAALQERGIQPDLAAGHSLGEYSALVVTGALGFVDAVRLVRRRGEFMQEAVPVGTGAMAALLGLELPAAEQACAEAAQGEVVSVANMNSPGQIVIAGHKTSVSLEDEFWRSMKEIATLQDLTLSDLVSEIDKGRTHGNLSCAIRLHVLDFYRKGATKVEQPQTSA